MRDRERQREAGTSTLNFPPRPHAVPERPAVHSPGSPESAFQQRKRPDERALGRGRPGPRKARHCCPPHGPRSDPSRDFFESK